MGHWWLLKLSAMISLQKGWDGYDADPPSSLAIAKAQEFLHDMERLGCRPTRVAPSVIGGIGVTRESGDHRAYVEFHNNGQIVALFRDRFGNPKTHGLDGNRVEMLDLIAFIKEFVPITPEQQTR